MKRLLLFVCISIYALSGYGQTTGNFVVNGDIDKYYPVTFVDGGWSSNMATELELGRSGVHVNENWRGSLNAKFRFHTTNWGNGSNFIDGQVRQFTYQPTDKFFVAGWKDVTANNADNRIVIWLKGGGTTYYYKSNYAVTPTVYDGVQNPLPYQETSGVALTYKTAVDYYVNSRGYNKVGVGINAKFNLDIMDLSNANDGIRLIRNDVSQNMDCYSVYNGSADEQTGSFAYGVRPSDDAWQIWEKGYTTTWSNLFTVKKDGNIGIGTSTPTSKLAVNGNIRAKEIKVETANWPDYVFTSTYNLPSLQETEQHIKEKGHLPGIPSAEEVKNNGVDLGEMNAKLLQKIEELTLHLIEQNKQLQTKTDEIIQLRELYKNLESQLTELKKLN